LVPTAAFSPCDPRQGPDTGAGSSPFDPGVLASSMTPLGVPSSEGASGSTISGLVLRGLVGAVERAGIERDSFLRRSAMAVPLEHASDVRVARAEIFRLCESAVELTRDPALGIHWSEGSSERVFAPISHLVTYCPTLRRAFELLAQFFPLFADDAPYRIYESEQHFTIQVSSAHHHSLVARRFEAEMLLGGFCKLTRIYAPRAAPLRVNFDYPAPDYHAEYARLFAGRERFDQPFTGLVFARSLLDAPSPQEHEDMREALEAVAEQRLARTAKGTSYAQRALDFLLREGWPERTNMESVARGLALSPRSLRRRLEDEGISYKSVLREAQATLAKRLLNDPKRSIKEVAYEMGFSDPNTFHRAFKTWTGVTPTEYRTGRASA
jgi:AraC-like DNA-binding protein